MSLLEPDTPWVREENILDKRIQPFAATHDYRISTGGHHYDTICYLAGLPLYSHASGNLEIPTWESFTRYLKTALEERYGAGTPGSRYYVMGAYALGGVIPSIAEIRMTLAKTKISEMNPDDGIVHRGQIYVKIQPAHLLKIFDPNQELGNDGPLVIMRGNNNYAAAVRMGYDPVSKCWMPFLREGQHCYLDEDMHCVLLELFARSKLEDVKPNFHPPAVEAWGERTAHEMKMADHKISLLPPGQKMTIVIRKTKLFIKQCEHPMLRVYFDLETFYSLPDAAPTEGLGIGAATGGLVPYSLVYMALTEDEFVDQAQNPWTTEELKDRAKLLKGFDCVQEFVDYLTGLVVTGKYAEIKLCAYNGSGFDFFFVLQAVEQRTALFEATLIEEDGEWVDSTEPGIYWTNQFFSNGRLLSGTMRVRHPEEGLMTSRISLFDISKHMIGMSLSNCCKAFKTPHKKVEGFSHDEVMNLYMANPSGFFNEPEFSRQLEEYNKFDVIALMELETAYIREMSKLVPFISFHSELPLTIGSLAYKILTNDWKGRDVEVERLDLGVELDWSKKNLSVAGLWQPIDVYMYRSFKTGIPGGISNVVNGPQIVEEPVSSPDVKGLYSYVECVYPCYFPVGPYVRLDVGQQPRDPSRILGIYHIDVDMRPLMEKDLHLVLPLKFFTRSGQLLRNNWNETEVNDTWVTTPILKILLAHGCPITWRGGYEWGGRVKSCELFAVFLPFIGEKNRQDKLKNPNHPDHASYNPAMRTVCKGVPNCGYGQSIAGVFPRSVTSVTPAALEKLYDDPKVARVNVIKIINGRAYADVTYKLESRMNRQHPLAMGCFILGYSQEYMFKQILHRVPRSLLLYIDTDSCKIPTRVYKELQERHAGEKVPHWPEILNWVPDYEHCPLWEGWEGGAFEDELPPNGGGILAAKKTYVILNEEQDGPCMEGEQIIMSSKGVRRSDVPLNAADYQRLSEVGDDYEAFLITAKEIYHTAPKLCEVAHVFMASVLKHGFGYVLCSSLLRSLTNLKRGTPADPESWNHSMGRLQQTYRLKRISIQDGGAGSKIPFILGQPLAAGAPELAEIADAGEEGEEFADEAEEGVAHYDDDVPECHIVFGDEEDEFPCDE